MTIALIIAHPNFEKPFILYMNTSGKGIKAVFYQKDNQDKERIIVYASRTLNKYEKNYFITEKKCLAII